MAAPADDRGSGWACVPVTTLVVAAARTKSSEHEPGRPPTRRPVPEDERGAGDQTVEGAVGEERAPPTNRRYWIAGAIEATVAVSKSGLLNPANERGVNHGSASESDAMVILNLTWFPIGTTSAPTGGSGPKCAETRLLVCRPPSCAGPTAALPRGRSRRCCRAIVAGCSINPPESRWSVPLAGISIGGPSRNRRERTNRAILTCVNSTGTPRTARIYYKSPATECLVNPHVGGSILPRPTSKAPVGRGFCVSERCWTSGIAPDVGAESGVIRANAGAAPHSPAGTPAPHPGRSRITVAARHSCPRRILPIARAPRLGGTVDRRFPSRRNTTMRGPSPKPVSSRLPRMCVAGALALLAAMLLAACGGSSSSSSSAHPSSGAEHVRHDCQLVGKVAHVGHEGLHRGVHRRPAVSAGAGGQRLHDLL